MRRRQRRRRPPFRGGLRPDPGPRSPQQGSGHRRRPVLHSSARPEAGLPRALTRCPAAPPPPRPPSVPRAAAVVSPVSVLGPGHPCGLQRCLVLPRRTWSPVGQLGCGGGLGTRGWQQGLGRRVTRGLRRRSRGRAWAAPWCLGERGPPLFLLLWWRARPSPRCQKGRQDEARRRCW